MPDVLSPPERTVGYRYYMGMHVIICHGPVDEVTEIIAGDRVAWSGSVSGNTRIFIDAAELFGGDKREGGIEGDVDVEFGGLSQGSNDYLEGAIGSAPQPGYRGVLGFVFRQTLMTANNPYLKPFAFKVRRIPKGWNEPNAQIGDGANPVHCIRELLTNVQWGMGYPSSAIDDASFTAAAATLVAEGFGVSLIWTRQQELRALIQELLDHVGGVLTVSPSSGLFQVKLIRDDYSIPALPVVDESVVLDLESYQRAAWGETVNELTVIYTRRENFKDASVTVQDLGNVQIQGPVTETRRYPGITDPDLAAQVAMRDLTSLSRPLAKLTIRANREAWSLLPGDPFVFKWADLGIVENVMRVVAIDTGTLEDTAIRVQAVEDTWNFRRNAYTAPEPIGWQDPVQPPADADPRLVVEASYWDLAVRLPQDALDNLDPLASYLATLGGRPHGTAINYELHTKTSTAGWDERQSARGSGDFAPHAVLDAELVPELVTTVGYSSEVDIDLPKIPDYAYIEGATPGDHETVAVLAIDRVARTVQLERGLIDTVPAAHAAGARIWFAELFQQPDFVEYADGEQADVRMRTRTTTGRLEFDSTAVTSITLSDRKERPYAPGALTINGQVYPSEFEATLTVGWAHRDRLSQTASKPNQTDPDIGPELGTTYTLRIYGETGALQATFSGLTGTSHAYTAAEDIADNGLGRASTKLSIELEAVRGGLTSWQAHRLTVQRTEAAGWGFQWGFNYGGPPP